MSRTHINCIVNGEPTDFLSADSPSLLDALRDELGLTGTKEGCGTGDCGSCSILFDGKLNCSCLILAPEAVGREEGAGRTAEMVVQGLPAASQVSASSHGVAQAWSTDHLDGALRVRLRACELRREMVRDQLRQPRVC